MRPLGSSSAITSRVCYQCSSPNTMTLQPRYLNTYHLTPFLSPRAPEITSHRIPIPIPTSPKGNTTQEQPQSRNQSKIHLAFPFHFHFYSRPEAHRTLTRLPAYSRSRSGKIGWNGRSRRCSSRKRTLDARRKGRTPRCREWIRRDYHLAFGNFALAQSWKGRNCLIFNAVPRAYAILQWRRVTVPIASFS